MMHLKLTIGIFLVLLLLVAGTAQAKDREDELNYHPTNNQIVVDLPAADTIQVVTAVQYVKVFTGDE